HCMLTSVNLNNHALSMAGEVDNVPINLNLATKMCVGYPETMTQMPPQFALCIRRSLSHLSREPPLGRNLCTIGSSPNSHLLVSCHYRPPNNDPHPQPLPTRGRGADPSLWPGFSINRQLLPRFNYSAISASIFALSRTAPTGSRQPSRREISAPAPRSA